MPIAPTNLEQQFSSLSTEDRPTKTAEAAAASAQADDNNDAALGLVTPVKIRRDHDLESENAQGVLFSPASVGGGSPEPTLMTNAAAALVSPEDNTSLLLKKTEQKLREERGELAPEPLLKENPQRFVIFPIQDNDVSSIYENMRKWLWFNSCMILITVSVDMKFQYGSL